jgi:hypothetical protein
MSNSLSSGRVQPRLLPLIAPLLGLGQLAQFSDNPRRTPGRIRLPHRLDDLADFFGHSGATGICLLTHAPPVVTKTLLLPGDDGTGLDER